MCGIAALVGYGWQPAQLAAMVESQRHRGPDAEGVFVDPSRCAGLGHNRLSIIDLSDAGRQPMVDASGRYRIVFNGEIYNYLELRKELEAVYPFRTRTDTEVLLAAYVAWGAACLERLVGMFAFAVWDGRDQVLFAARDRFGVKPLYLHEPKEGGLGLASEIKALHAAGVPREPDAATWATYFVSGMYDHGEETFWQGIRQLPQGHFLRWSEGRGVSIRRYYDPADAAIRSGLDERDDDEVADELLALLEQSLRLRFRSDVPVGVCLSGGLDSSLLLGLIRRIFGRDAEVNTFTFYCGDADYDETPWVELMLSRTNHRGHYCLLRPEDVPELASRVLANQDEPFGGLPTLGMARVHERARDEGVTVLLDGNGMDEGWAGYEYYGRAGSISASMGPVQGSRSPATRPDCLVPEFAALARHIETERPFHEPLRDLQYRDIRRAKIPRAMRFADRVSMMFGRELREPFLDQRIVELGLRQPPARKIREGRGKWLPRRVADSLLPETVREAPKRAVQTPQREWLRGSLSDWAASSIETALTGWASAWWSARATKSAWRQYLEGQSDNSFPVWQWVSLGLIQESEKACL